MRISYQNGSLYLSLTDDEVDRIYEKKHSSVHIDISNLKVLHEDVSNAVLQYWKDKGIDDKQQETNNRPR